MMATEIPTGSYFPLVSVLLCHHNLRHMVKIAINSYLTQEYVNKELVVIDDGDEPISDLVQGIENCRYHFIPSKNLSQKRNAGCQASVGEFVIHFDADDWSGPLRIRDQVKALDNGAQVAGYAQALWYDFVEKRASYYKGCVWGASLIYRRSYVLTHPWDESCPFAEDGPFLSLAREKDSVVSTDGKQNLVATMHSRNAHRAAVGLNDLWPYVGLDSLPEGFRKAAGV